MNIEALEKSFSICKLAATGNVDVNVPYSFLSVTDNEVSLICPTANVPDDVRSCDDGWRVLRIEAPANRKMVGLLLDISKILTFKEISILPVTTFDTIYFFVPSDCYLKAIDALSDGGYKVKMSYL